MSRTPDRWNWPVRWNGPGLMRGAPNTAGSQLVAADAIPRRIEPIPGGSLPHHSNEAGAKIRNVGGPRPYAAETRDDPVEVIGPDGASVWVKLSDVWDGKVIPVEREERA